jgi:outer membrane protein
MNHRRLCTAFVIAGLSAFRAIAQPAWTLDQCISNALGRSPSLQAARNQALVPQLSQQELSKTKLPQARLSAAVMYAPTPGTMGYDPAITNGGEVAGQLVVQQSIYDGGIRSLKADQFQIDQQQRSTDILRTERDLVFSVRQAYIEALRAKQERTFQSVSVSQLEDYLQLAKGLARGGIASSTDVMKADIQLSKARIALRRAEEVSESAEITLKEVIGIPADTAITFAGTLSELSIGVSDSMATARLDGASQNLDLIRSEMDISRSLIDVEMTGHEMYPTLSLVADAGLLTSGDNIRLPSDAREPMVGFSLALAVEIPLLNWGATDLRVQQRQILSENLRLDHDQLRRSFIAQARRLRLQLMNARERERAASHTITTAEDNFSLTKSKFAAGTALSLDVLVSQQLLTESKLSEAQAQADIQSTLARIDQLLAR